jgi:hypothetical protein
MNSLVSDRLIPSSSAHPPYAMAPEKQRQAPRWATVRLEVGKRGAGAPRTGHISLTPRFSGFPCAQPCRRSHSRLKIPRCRQLLPGASAAVLFVGLNQSARETPQKTTKITKRLRPSPFFRRCRKPITALSTQPRESALLPLLPWCQ